MEATIGFSLLWPDYRAGKEQEERIGSGEGKQYNQDVLERDINVEMILAGMQIRKEARQYVRARLTDMTMDDSVIQYRQEILQDFLRYPEMEQILEAEWMPLVSQLQKMEKTNISSNDDIRKTAWRLDMLKSYVRCVTVLEQAFGLGRREFHSAGLQRLQELLQSITQNDGYQELVRLLPDLLEKMQTMTSVTIGINLDNELRPTEAILLSIEARPFRNRGLLTSLFGKKKNDEAYQGLSSFYSIFKDGSSGALDQAIVRDLTRIMGDTFRSLASVLARYEWMETRFLFDWLPEIYYYIGGSRLFHQMTDNGLPMCFPTPLPADDRVFVVKNLYDASFALRILSDTGIKALQNIVVPNDAVMDNQAGRIFILTGANQGGKTTFTRAIGIAQLLFQAGFPIPGTEGRISPVDNIYTHFPELEKNSISEGRLGEECIRLESILPRLSKHSLFLMNESLSSTSHQECLFIAEEIMRYLRVIGARAVFATHIHELAEEIPLLNREEGLSNLISLVAGVEESSDEEGRQNAVQGARRTYRIVPMPPQGKSFAMDIARTYGISLEQLLESHKKRTVSLSEKTGTV